MRNIALGFGKLVTSGEFFGEGWGENVPFCRPGHLLGLREKAGKWSPSGHLVVTGHQIVV